jgi:hypothetical protein
VGGSCVAGVGAALDEVAGVSVAGVSRPSRD